MARGHHTFSPGWLTGHLWEHYLLSRRRDGALWALNVNTGQVQWTYWAGFNVRGHTALCSSPAVDESRGWVIGIADTGRMFVLNKNTGRVVKEAFLGLTSWNVFDPHPDSGYWLPGPSGIAIVPEDGLLYVAGTDYDRAWLGSMFDRGREKLFCYDYVTDPNTLIKVWEYQFCTNDDCSTEANQLIVNGHGPYVVAWYSVPSPALADGHVYYASTNAKIYCFGSDLPTDDSDGDGVFDYRDNCIAKQNGSNGGTCSKGSSAGSSCTIPGNNTSECGTGGFCSMDQEDEDRDGIGDVCDSCTDTEGDGYGNPGFPLNTCGEDNCPITPNGPNGGTCVKTEYGVTHSYRVGNPKKIITCDSENDCTPTGGTCQMEQGNCNGNSCGDVCECYADCNGSSGIPDGRVSTPDYSQLKIEFGRFDCAQNPCKADFNGDNRVSTPDYSLLKQEFGRFDCPLCQ